MALNDQAFSYSKRSYVQQSIQTLYNRTKLHFRHGLTHADLFELLVQPKDREVLKRVSKITNAANRAQDILVPGNFGTWENLQIRFDIPPDEKDGFLIPNYAAKGIQKKLSEEVEEKLKRAIDYSAKRNSEWRLVLSVFEALSARCTAPAQMKFFMPGIVSLFRISHGEGYTAENDYADRLYSMGTPSMIPSVEPELRKAAIEVGVTITRGMMMSEKATEAPDAITMTVFGRNTETVPWSDTVKLSGLA